ncbi:MAG: ribonuclease H family protein [Candidatus Binataceae bacterium]
MDAPAQFTVYADGSCIGNPGRGGWGFVMRAADGVTIEDAGADPSTTNNRMEITAALEALRRTPADASVALHSDSQYLVKTMTLGWKRRENLDLWRLLDAEVAQRRVRWHWVRGHSGDAGNERADELARSAAEGRAPRPGGAIASAETTNHASARKETADGIAPLLGPRERLRRCASCGEAFVASGNARHCSRVPCQLAARRGARAE